MCFFLCQNQGCDISKGSNSFPGSRNTGNREKDSVNRSITGFSLKRVISGNIVRQCSSFPVIIHQPFTVFLHNEFGPRNLPFKFFFRVAGPLGKDIIHQYKVHIFVKNCGGCQCCFKNCPIKFFTLPKCFFRPDSFGDVKSQSENANTGSVHIFKRGNMNLNDQSATNPDIFNLFTLQPSEMHTHQILPLCLRNNR